MNLHMPVCLATFSGFLYDPLKEDMGGCNGTKGQDDFSKSPDRMYVKSEISW